MTGPAAPDSQLDEHVDATFSVQLPLRPYPGLRPFEQHEWPIFFGRETMADAVATQLIEKRLLVVHGDSGCGKSSLIRAAVLPRLLQDSARGGIRWRTCVMTPGQTPLLNLAKALAGIEPTDEGRVLDIRRLLNLGRDAPIEIAKLLVERDGDCICIVIDQFEELFAHARRVGPEDAQILVNVLTSLLETPPDGLYAVLTMRSEFIGACARFSGLAEAVNAAQYLLPRMQHRDIVRAICEPATLYDGEISTQLAERLIADAGDSQDQLPLIQHGLMLLHREFVEGGLEGQGWRLGLEQYANPRGLAGQLSEHADAVMAQAVALFPDVTNGSQVVQTIFRALTETDADGHAIRRPQTVTELSKLTDTNEDLTRQVVNLFRADGTSLLRPHGSAELRGDTQVNISHEALIRSWVKLSAPITGWLSAELRDGFIWRLLLVQAEDFKRDPSNLLSGTTTDEREQWLRGKTSRWASQYGGDWDGVHQFIGASARARNLERREAYRRTQRRRLYGWLASLTLLVACAVIGFRLLNRTEQAVKDEGDKTVLLNQAEVTINNERAKVEKANAINAALQGVVSEQSAIVDRLAKDSAAPQADLQKVGETLKAAAASSAFAGSPNEGFVWLGNERSRNLRDENGLVNVQSVQAGSTYVSVHDLALRNGPASGSVSGRVIGSVPKGSQLRVLESPNLINSISGKPQSWAHVQVLGRPGVPKQIKVFLQFAEGTELNLNLLRDQLRNANYDFQADERLPSAAGLNEVRYCHTEDQAVAARLAGDVEALRKGIPIAVNRIGGGRQCLKVTGPGTLELWLGEL